LQTIEIRRQRHLPRCPGTIKRSYNEDHSADRRADQAAKSSALATSDPRTHALFHIHRGHELLAQGFAVKQSKNLREAVALTLAIPDAHAGLAAALEAISETAAARMPKRQRPAFSSLPRGRLVLARLDLRDQ